MAARSSSPRAQDAAAHLLTISVKTRTGSLILLAVFDDESSLGLVQLFFAEFCASIAAIAPAEAPAGAALAEDFERELNRNLAVMFGRA